MQKYAVHSEWFRLQPWGRAPHSVTNANNNNLHRCPPILPAFQVSEAYPVTILRLAIVIHVLHNYNGMSDQG